MHFGVGVTSPYIFNYHFMSLIFNSMFTEDIFESSEFEKDKE